MVSAVVLAKNEQDSLGRCLESLKWCSEILVIDDHSTDQTREIAEKHQAKVITRGLNNDFASQRNFALGKAKNDWVFFVDADEEVCPNLAREIQDKLTKTPGADGFYLKRIDFFQNRWLSHGEIGRIKLLRLAKKDQGKWKRPVEEIWEINGKTETLKNALLHFSHSDLKQALQNINERSSLNARVFYQEGKRVGFLEWLKPEVKFFQNYFFRLGFLDGTGGFVFAVLMSLHSFLVRGKLYLLWRKDAAPEKPKKIDNFFFLIWSALVFCSYIFYLLQRGLKKW